jgi:toxin HigB-1
VIHSFRNKATKDIFNGANSKDARNACPIQLWKTARRKLFLINFAKDLPDLKVPPGNQFETLGKDRTSQYSIRINDQYRICFYWNNDEAEEVEITDYH